MRPGETRSQPNTSTARKPDSRKNAKMPSAASADPNHVAHVARVHRPVRSRTGTPSRCPHHAPWQVQGEDLGPKRAAVSYIWFLVLRYSPSITTSRIPKPIRQRREQ